MLIGFRPDDSAYLTHSGATFDGQDEGGSGSLALYIINNQSDEIDFDVSDYMAGLDRPVAVFNTAFGETDFKLEDLADNDEIINEQSGYDSDVWMVDLSETSGRLRLTDFDPSGGADGTQAAWYPYLRLLDLEA